MAKKLLGTFFLLILPFAFGVTTAIAGGWASIELDELPGGISAGEAFTVKFTVLQHGVSPMDGLEPVIHASLPGSKTSLDFQAENAKGEGRYQVTLNLPEAGEWIWSIKAFTMNQPMPPIQVSTSSPIASNVTGNSYPSYSFAALTLWAGAVLLASAMVALLLWLRKRSRWALAITFATGALGLVAFTLTSLPETGGAAGSLPQEIPSNLAEVGKDLFVAKGCITCHNHQDATLRGTQSLEIGPDLSEFTAHPDYLQMWLENPREIKPNTSMPDPHLAPEEIAALVAFLGK